MAKLLQLHVVYINIEYPVSNDNQPSLLNSNRILHIDDRNYDTRPRNTFGHSHTTLTKPLMNWKSLLLCPYLFFRLSNEATDVEYVGYDDVCVCIQNWYTYPSMVKSLCGSICNSIPFLERQKGILKYVSIFCCYYWLYLAFVWGTNMSMSRLALKY